MVIYMRMKSDEQLRKNTSRSYARAKGILSADKVKGWRSSQRNNQTANPKGYGRIKGEIMKIIRVKSCETCPYYDTCKAWKSLTRKQRVSITISMRTPKDFMLKACHLEDDPESKGNEK